MFTGLVQKKGKLQRIFRSGEGWSLEIAHPPWHDELVVGESVAVQGVCLTVTSQSPGAFVADILDETYRRTALREIAVGAGLNLERALAMGERVGGHFVSGHVDEPGTLLEIRPCGRDQVWRVGCSATLSMQSVMKGSIAIDGVSLTISDLSDGWLEVNLIPHTLSVTTLGERRVGDGVNLEADMIGKYVARMLGQASRTGVTEQLLAENGFIV